MKGQKAFRYFAIVSLPATESIKTKQQKREILLVSLKNAAVEKLFHIYKNARKFLK